MNHQESISKQLTPKSFIPLLLLILILIIYFDSISDYWVYKYKVGIGISASVIALLLLIWTILTLMPSFLLRRPLISAIIGIAVFFGFAILHVERGEAFIENEFKFNHDETIALVMNKNEDNLDFDGFRDVEISYKTKDGAMFTSSLVLPEQTFNRVKSFNKLPVVYSINYPDLVRLDIHSYFKKS